MANKVLVHFSLQSFSNGKKREFGYTEQFYQCIDADAFEKNVLKILEEQRTEYEIEYVEAVGLQEIQKTDQERFGKYGVEEVIGKESYLPLLKVCPLIYLYSRLIKKGRRQ